MPKTRVGIHMPVHAVLGAQHVAERVREPAIAAGALPLHVVAAVCVPVASGVAGVERDGGGALRVGRNDAAQPLRLRERVVPRLKPVAEAVAEERDGAPLARTTGARALRDEMAGGQVELIDVREPAEFAVERIHGALNLPLSTFDPSTLPEAGDKLIAESTKLAAAAKTGNLDNLKTAFGATAGTCKACHDAFRTQ